MYASAPLTINRSGPVNSLSNNPSDTSQKSVNKGAQTISNTECSRQMIVNQAQLKSLVGTRNVTVNESIHCELTEYGNHYPKQVRPAAQFHGALNNDEKLVEHLFSSARVSRSVFNPEGSPGKPVKKGHESTGFKERWTDQEKNTREANKFFTDPNKQKFNGKQLCVYFSFDPNINGSESKEITLKLLPSDFFSQTITRRSSTEDNYDDIPTVRAAYNCGSIMLVMTNDNKVVFGHRNGKPMFPAGFILGARSQQTDESVAPILAEIGKTTTFEDLARDTALNERREEVYDDQGKWKTEIKTFGAIGETLCWPSKQEDRSYQKPVFVIKSTVFMEHIPVSSTELNTLRSERPAKDGHELGELHFLSEKDITSVNNDNKFIMEHETCRQLLKRYFTRKADI